MRQEMRRVTDVRSFMAAGRKVRGEHAFSGTIKRMPWKYCTRCGLMTLRNEATRRAMKAPCETWDDDT